MKVIIISGDFKNPQKNCKFVKGIFDEQIRYLDNRTPVNYTNQKTRLQFSDNLYLSILLISQTLSWKILILKAA